VETNQASDREVAAKEPRVRSRKVRSRRLWALRRARFPSTLQRL